MEKQPLPRRSCTSGRSPGLIRSSRRKWRSFPSKASSLLAYLLPFCLELWCEDLRGTSDKYGGFVEHLYPVLADRAIFDQHLTSKQSAAVSEFMRQTVLDEVDDQLGLAHQGLKARPYRWIGDLTTYTECYCLTLIACGVRGGHWIWLDAPLPWCSTSRV